MTICVPVTADGAVEPRWGRAPRVAIATIRHGAIEDWVVHDVGWDTAHEEGAEGQHHARVARFLTDNGVECVVAEHMGPPMERMLVKMGIAVRLGASGDARAAVLRT